MRRRASLLTTTAVLEAPTGLLLVLLPAPVLVLLFGWRQPGAEALVMARLAGGAVLGLRVSSWAARRRTDASGQRAVLTGVVTYQVVAAGVLVYVGAGLGMVGPLLWPAVILHIVFGAWSTLCLVGITATPISCGTS
jgi:hypothetical protein